MITSFHPSNLHLYLFACFLFENVIQWHVFWKINFNCSSVFCFYSQKQDKRKSLYTNMKCRKQFQFKKGKNKVIKKDVGAGVDIKKYIISVMEILRTDASLFHMHNAHIFATSSVRIVSFQHFMYNNA